MQLLVQSIREILSEVFLNEISYAAINHVLERNSDKLPFDDLFDGQLRKVIPIDSPVVSKMKGQLQNQGFEVDVKNRKAFVTKQTQRGPKKIEMRLGKAIGSTEKSLLTALKNAFTNNGSLEQNNQYFKDFVGILNKVKSFVKNEFDVKSILADIKLKHEDFSLENHKEIALRAIDYLQFLSLKKDFEKSGNELDTSDYSIVLSRAPADVLRMSDHRGMSSCHAEGHDYFQCAITEAIRGGAIAYVVRTKDLEDTNLQDSEIFEDSDRRIAGIEPLSRIRIRNFASPDVELAVPETRSYGNNIAGFKSTLTKWARDAQISKFTDEDGNVVFPDIDDFVLRGGTYTDTEADELLNNLFDTDEFVGDIDAEDNDEEYGDSFESIVDQLESELSEYVEQSSTGDVNFYFDQAEMVEEDRAYFSVSANLSVEMPDDVAKALDELSWRDRQEYIDAFVYEIDVSYSDYEYNHPYMSIYIEDQDLTAVVTPDDTDLDNLKSTIDYWENYSFDVEDGINAVRNKLIIDDHLPGYQEDYADELADKFTNFSIEFEEDPSDEDFNVITATAIISNLEDIKNPDLKKQVNVLLSKKKFVELFFNEVVGFFKPNLKQLILPNVDYGPMSLIKAPDGATLVMSGGKIIMNVHFRVDDNAEDFIEFVSTMDKNLVLVEKILGRTIKQALQM